MCLNGCVRFCRWVSVSVFVGVFGSVFVCVSVCDYSYVLSESERDISLCLYVCFNICVLGGRRSVLSFVVVVSQSQAFNI